MYLTGASDVLHTRARPNATSHRVFLISHIDRLPPDGTTNTRASTAEPQLDRFFVGQPRHARVYIVARIDGLCTAVYFYRLLVGPTPIAARANEPGSARAIQNTHSSRLPTALARAIHHAQYILLQYNSRGRKYHAQAYTQATLTRAYFIHHIMPGTFYKIQIARVERQGSRRPLIQTRESYNI